jgi:hypothetical protein
MTVTAFLLRLEAEIVAFVKKTVTLFFRGMKPFCRTFSRGFYPYFDRYEKI